MQIFMNIYINIYKYIYIYIKKICVYMGSSSISRQLVYHLKINEYSEIWAANHYEQHCIYIYVYIYIYIYLYIYLYIYPYIYIYG